VDLGKRYFGQASATTVTSSMGKLNEVEAGESTCRATMWSVCAIRQFGFVRNQGVEQTLLEVQ